jgi:alkylation response protein AidB-like acyl-CoA dehydrogenase
MKHIADAEFSEFRDEVRAWIAENFPGSLKNMANPMSREAMAFPTDDQEIWRNAMASKGWGTPTWPTEYGAAGLAPTHAQVIQQELVRAGAYNPIGGMGVMMFGPTLLEYGTPAQKQQHLPPIVRGDFQWCQGFSEPGAGSDLVSLQTRAEDKGDHFLVNGQKVWTSGAQWARWCFCLVRTDPHNKYNGISLVLFPMSTPGVEARPIKLISGASSFCELFLTDVSVPKDQLVGPLNGGWAIAKRLLQHERSALSGAGATSPVRSLPDLAKDYVGTDAEGGIADSDLRTRIIANQMDARVFELTALRAAAEATGGGGPSAASSIMKNAATRLTQQRAELTIELMGYRGLGWEGEAFAEHELGAVREWLYGKAVSIYGGSQEVQNNIISKRILELPDARVIK